MSYTLKKLKKEEIKRMSFEDIFLSSEYQNTLIDLMYAACLRVNYTRPLRLFLKNDPDSSDIACTDGNIIFVNLGSKFASRLKEIPVLFHIYVVGLIAHELGHVYWTEFDDGEKYIESIQCGKLYPTVPKHPNASRFVDALKDKANRKMFCHICHSLDNILEDVFINALQAEMLGGLYSKGISLGNTLIIEEMSSIEQQKGKGYYDFNIIMNCLLAQLKCGTVVYASYESLYKPVVERVSNIANEYIFKKCHKERLEGINLIICELWDYIEEMLADIKKNASQDSAKGNGSSEKNDSGKDSSQNSTQNASGGNGGKKSGSESKEESESSSSENNNCESKGDSQNKASEGENGDEKKSSEVQKQSSEGDSSNNETTGGNAESDGDGGIDEESLEKALEKALEQLQGQTQETVNQNTSPIAGKHEANPSSLEQDNSLKKELDKKEEQERFPVSVGEAIASIGSSRTITERNYVPDREATAALKSIVDSLANDRAEKGNSDACSKALVETVQAADFGPIHAGIDKKIYQISGKSSDAKIKYESMVKEVSSIVSKLVKVIERTIKEENLTGERRGLYYGKKINTSRLYSPDLKVFKDRKNPKKEADVAFYILVDVSGSMYGRKIEAAKLASVMFAEACENLQIPIEITGHSTIPGGKGISLYSFLRYGSVVRSDKYSLSYMKDEYSNRDGAAIIYGCERLLTRPEKKKIFCIISDGQPADRGYSGETAKADMKNIKNKYVKNGITFVAAAIDSDKEFIKEIYGKNFLNISNLESMPQTFGKILQNAVLS